MGEILNKIFELSRSGQIESVKYSENKLLTYTQTKNEISIDFNDVLNFIKINSSLFKIEVIEETEEILLTFCGEQINGFDSDFIEL